MHIHMRPIVPQPIQTPRAPKDVPKAVDAREVGKVTERQPGGDGGSQERPPFRRRSEGRPRSGAGAAFDPGASLALTLAVLTLDALPSDPDVAATGTRSLDDLIGAAASS